MAAKMLLSMCQNVNARFASTADTTDVRSEFLLLETLLVKALSETAPATLAYDCAVLTHLVKSDARVVSPALAVIVELLFRELPTMRAGVRDAFVLLFSHFLSNFEFKWPWTHWAHVLEAEEDDAQRLFVSAVIERCVRLSYLQHMQTVLPTDFHMLLPPSPMPRIRFRSNKASGEGAAMTDGDNVDPTNESSSTSEALSELYEAATAKLKTHPPAIALQAWLFEEAEQRGVSREDALEVVWTCILEAGAATYTHMRLLLEKYSQAEQLRGGDEDELVLVRAVASVWLKSPQHIALILNAMLRHGVLRPTTIVQWVFTPDAIQQYSWPYVWGIVDDTMMFVQSSIAMAKAAKSSEGNDDGDNKMDGGDEEDVIAKRESELREMVKILFEGFNRAISGHKTQCDAEGVNYQDNWFASALVRMKSVGRAFRAPLEDVASALEAETFRSNAADHDARKVFELVWDSYRSS
jgi:nuclear cap-binding protein subunit 1